MSIIKTQETHEFSNGKLEANAGDWNFSQIIFQQRSSVFSSNSAKAVFTKPMNGVNQITIQNFDWSAEGYSVGDIVKGFSFMYYWVEVFDPFAGGYVAGPLQTTTLTYFVTISAIIGDTITLAGDPYTLSTGILPFQTTLASPTTMAGTVRYNQLTATSRVKYEYQDVELVNTSRPDRIEFTFNLARNGTTTQNSVIDGEVNKFTLNGVLAIPTGVPTVMAQSNNKSGGYFKDVVLTKYNNHSDYSTQFRISFKYFDWGIIEDALLEPSYYDNTDQLIPISHITTITAGGGADTLVNTTAAVDSTGGFNEVFNGGQHPFVVNSIQWYDLLGNTIDGLDYSGASTFKAVINTGGNQNANHRYKIGLAWRPEDSAVYQNKNTNLGQNLLINAPDVLYAPAVTPSTNIHLGETTPGGARWDFSNLMFKIVGLTLEITGKVTPNAACNTLFGSIPDGGRRSTLWVAMGSTPYLHTNGQYYLPQQDRVSLILSDEDNIDAPILGVQIPDVVEEVLLDHNGNDITNHTTPNTTTEDDVLYRSAFLLPDNQVINGFRSRISAINTITGEDFTLENNYISFASVVNVGGQYQPNITQSRGFNLPPTTDRNNYTLKRKASLDVPGKYGIEFEYGFLNDWRYWLAQSNADNYFFSPNPNTNPVPPGTPLVDNHDGKNKNWQHYFSGDWIIRIEYFLDKAGIEDFNYKPFKIRTYEDDIDVSAAANIVLVAGGVPVTQFLNNSLHELTVVFTWNQNFTDEWVEFTIEDFESGNRWVISSVLPQGGIGSNPLKPIPGSTVIDVTGSGTNILTCKALVDTSVISSGNVSISYRVYSSPNVNAPVSGAKQKTSGDYKTLTGGAVKLKA